VDDQAGYVCLAGCGGLEGHVGELSKFILTEMVYPKVPTTILYQMPNKDFLRAPNRRDPPVFGLEIE
jgi:hypothetical protein